MPTEHKKRHTIVLEQDGYTFLNTLVLQSDVYDVEKNTVPEETEEIKNEKAELDSIIRVGAHTSFCNDKQKSKKENGRSIDVIKNIEEKTASLIFKKIDSEGVTHVYSYQNDRIKTSPHIIRVDEQNKYIPVQPPSAPARRILSKPIAEPSYSIKEPMRGVKSENFFKTIVLTLREIQNFPSTIFQNMVRYNTKLKKETLIFACVSIIAIFPLYYGSYIEKMFERFGILERSASQAVGYLGTITDSDKTPSSITTKLSYAAMSFDMAYSVLREYNSTLITISKKIPFAGDKIKLGESLLKTGKQISDASQSLASVLTTMSLNNDNEPLTETLVKMRAHVLVSQKSLNEAGDTLSNINDSNIPSRYKDQILLVKQTLPSIERFVSKTDTMLLALINLFGHYDKKKYLFVFQNTAEIRPTGGFIGSFAEVTLDHGLLKDTIVPGGGAYDTKGGLTTRVFSPKPLGLIAPRWYMWDANWWPDFPTSAKKIMWFYEKSGGTSVDGVIAINSDIVEKLLALTGPIEMPEYGKTITSENFYEETQSAVEVEYDKKENKPKKFIGDLMPKILDRIFNTKESDLFPLISLFYDGFTQKNIQIYARDQKTQEYVENLGWAGEIQSIKGDYLMVAHTNIGGGKSDAVVSTNVHHTADVQPDGSIVDTVEITRRHNGPSNMIYTDANNVDYVRIYVPKGSKLVSVSGYKPPNEDLFKQEKLFALNTDSDIDIIEQYSNKDSITGTDISEQFDKTVFGNWIQTAPFSSSTITFSYLLPFSLSSIDSNPQTYSLYVQKQSGIDNTYISSSFNPSKADSLSVEWTASSYNAKNSTVDQNLIQCEGVLSEDMYCTTVLKPRE